MLSALPAPVVDRVIRLAEAGRLGDGLLRFGVRNLVASRARDEARIGRTAAEFARAMREQPVAVHTTDANVQHYEVPAEFFAHVLGPRLKYSCAWFGDGVQDLADAEDAMLALTCDRAGIEDGMRILDLGCGWGSFTTWAAEHYPNARILAVSNSRTQRAFIRDRCAKRGLDRVEVVTANAAALDFEEGRFDRVVSVEMFEHMRNWHELYRRIARWLTPDGRFFQHVFCHRAHPYWFEADSEADWMEGNFFSGGIMPSFDLPAHVGGGLAVEKQWKVGGAHYARTSEAWLERTDRFRDELVRIFRAHPDVDPHVAVQRWRMFFIACAELFGHADGEEWFVGHYRLRPSGERG